MMLFLCLHQEMSLLNLLFGYFFLLIVPFLVFFKQTVEVLSLSYENVPQLNGCHF